MGQGVVQKSDRDCTFELSSQPMKYVIAIPLLCFAVLVLALVLRPSTSASLSEDLQRPIDAIKIEMPRIGTVIKLPKKDYFGRIIEPVYGRAVVAMPACQSCTQHHINWRTLKDLGREVATVLVFPDAPGPSSPALRFPQFLILVEGKEAILPARLYDFAPNCVWLDKQGKLIKSMATFALDATEAGANK